MREVTVHWGRSKLSRNSTFTLFDHLKEMTFLGYVERNHDYIDIMVQCIFVEGSGPEDIDGLIKGVSVVEVLSKPTSSWTEDWVLKIRFMADGNDLIGVQLSAVSANIQPNSRFDQQGFTYVVRGPAPAIKSVISAFRLILPPDKLSASSIQPANLLENNLVSPQQLKVVQGAWKAGWYDNPRKLKMSELSRELKLSRSTVSEHLARVETEMVRLLLEAVGDTLDDSLKNEYDLVDFWSHLHEADLPAVRNKVDQAKIDGQPYVITYRMRMLDGSYKLIRSHSLPQFDDEGQYLGVVGRFEDLSQNKEMEDILQLSVNIANSRYSSGPEDIPGSGTWEWHIASGDVVWSPSLFPMYGCDADEFSPSLDSFTNLLHPEDIEFVMNTLGECLQNQNPLDYVHRIVRPSDGSVRTMRCIGGILTDETGEPVKVIGISQDITEMEVADRALQESMESIGTASSIGQANFEVDDQNKTITISDEAVRLLRG